MRHDQDNQDPGILKRSICRACRCALKRNNNQEVKIIDDDFREQEILKLYAKVKENFWNPNKNKIMHDQD